MESDRILVAAGLTAAAVVSAFVFWGPATNTSGRGRLAGLINLGKTCFLNAVLHALAACPQFIAWLEEDRNARDTSLRSTLAIVLSVVNGTNRGMKESSVPVIVMNALKRLGWVIPPGEQDAHELLNILLTTLDEETHKKSRKIGCLSDALGINDLDDSDDFETIDDQQDFHSLGSVMSLNELCRPSSLNWRGSAIRRNRWISRSCRAIQLMGPPAQPVTHPFTGSLTNQLRCTECGFKSPVRYDKFENLSLALPSGSGDLGWGRHKLHQLLTNFVTPEVIPDVRCESCNKDRDPIRPILSRQIKIINFGKLPVCLCIHISRNVWSVNGISKRQDYVQFPMRLSLAAYTYIHSHYQRKLSNSVHTSSSEGGSPLSSSVPMWGAGSLSDMNEFRNIYQLAAVVVHTGDAHSGHFITYRKGHQNSKWYYTSDVEIREVTVDEVLQSVAYMLFYEKTSTLSVF